MCGHGLLLMLYLYYKDSLEKIYKVRNEKENCMGRKALLY